MKRPLFLLAASLLPLAPVSSPGIVDTDGNGLSDVFELQYNNGQPLDPNADPDGDGWTNASEFAASTNPFDANAPSGYVRPSCTDTVTTSSEPDGNGGTVISTLHTLQVAWPTKPGVKYTLLYSSDLGAESWQPVDDSSIGTGAVIEFNFPLANPTKTFWKVKMDEFDSDSDGVTDSEEHALALDPHKASTLTGYPDMWLAINFTAALMDGGVSAYNPDADTDDDGLSNADEYAFGTNPANDDEDGDGLADAFEIELGLNPNSGDSNQDGVPDGEELNTAQNNTPAANDPDTNVNSIRFHTGTGPRYALFPITNAATAISPPKAFQINDKGTVLYADGTWVGGKWTALSKKVDGVLTNASARGINDSDQILGIGYDDAVSVYPSYFAGLSCYWSAPDAQPAIVETGGGSSVRAGLPATVAASSPTISESGPTLANDGGFYCPTYQLKEDQSEWIFKHDSRWKMPSNGQPIKETTASNTLRFSASPALQWGFHQIVNYAGVDGSVIGNQAMPKLTYVPANVFTLPGGNILALAPASSSEHAQGLKNGAWGTSHLYKNAIDISADGIAIGRSTSLSSAPILIDGKWKVIFQYAPSVPDKWKDSSVNLLDTTPGGWILTERGNWPTLNTFLPEHAALLPIRADGVDPALPVPQPPPPNDPPEYLYGGVDHTSMMALEGKGRVPEIWIMAPNGGASTSVRFRSPLNANCKLTLESNDDIEYTPDELDRSDMVVQVKGNKTDTADHTAKLKLGGTVDSLSVPLKIKTMKKRTVKVAVHKVFGIDVDGVQTVPNHFPAMDVLERYLNEVFGKQANTFFECTSHDEKGPDGYGIHFDLNNDGKIAYAITDSEVQKLTVNPKATGDSNATANIDMWAFGGGVKITDSKQTYFGYQIGGEFAGKIIIDGDLLGETGLADDLSTKLLNVFAHEIGHVMLGAGHAHDGTCRSVLVWRKGTGSVFNSSGGYVTDYHNNTRLMVTGMPMSFSKSSKQLIKKEWDLMEAWLQNEEAHHRL